MREIYAKSQKLNSNLTHKQPKILILWDMKKNRRSGHFIAAVGSPSGRWIDDVRTLAASKRSRMVTRVQTI
jgi:hypothetical protein